MNPYEASLKLLNNQIIPIIKDNLKYPI